jgi:hypothetical protein
MTSTELGLTLQGALELLFPPKTESLGEFGRFERMYFPT